MKYHRLIFKKTSRVILKEDINVLLAQSFLQRLIGLLATKSMDANSGLLIKPCNSVHTIGMRFAIDVIFLNVENRIVKITKNLKSMRFSNGPKGAISVLEMQAGACDRLGLVLGDQVIFE